MVTRLYVDNFRCLLGFELRFGETNVLVGANGTGKTSVLDVLGRVQNLVVRACPVAREFPLADLSVLQDAPLQTVELDVDAGGRSYRYSVRIRLDRAAGAAAIAAEVLEQDGTRVFCFDDGVARLFRSGRHAAATVPCDPSRSALAAVEAVPGAEPVDGFRRAVADLLVVRPCVRSVRSETRVEDDFLEPSMCNFAAWYRRQAAAGARWAGDLFGLLAQVLSGFDSLRLAGSGDGPRVLEVLFRRGPGPDGVTSCRFDRLADGHRALILLYSLLVVRRGRRVSLFVDTPEHHLALREVEPWLAALGESCVSALDQAVVVSHHPVTIDSLAASGGRWFYRGAAGAARVRDEPECRVDGLRYSELLARGWDQP